MIRRLLPLSLVLLALLQLPAQAASFRLMAFGDSLVHGYGLAVDEAQLLSAYATHAYVLIGDNLSKLL